MVARGENDILHARLARESCDSSRIEILRCECLFQLVVLIERDFFQALDPFSFTQLGVESPMDEHSVGEGFESSDAGKWSRDRHGFTWSPNRGVERLQSSHLWEDSVCRLSSSRRNSRGGNAMNLVGEKTDSIEQGFAIAAYLLVLFSVPCLNDV